MSSETVIDVANLSKTYLIYAKPTDRLKQMIMPRLHRALGRVPRRYAREHKALSDVSFTVARGETVGVIGRNGSGKSTLLQILSQILPPTSGSVSVKGRIAALLELGAGFNPEFTGRENAALNAKILGFSDAEIKARMAEIEAFADIGEFFDRPVKLYSSGMYVRVAFAVQACVDPDILIVDEALAVGDEKFQRKCYDRFEALREKGTAILLVTHSTTTIERFCQRAILLHEGKLHGVGKSSSIVDQYHALLYADEKAYLKTLNAMQNEIQGLEDPISDLTPVEAAFVPAPAAVRETAAVCQALITSVSLTTIEGQPQEQFQPGQKALVSMTIRCHSDIAEIQAGITIKTVEGVHAFGTSTLYFNCNIIDAKAGCELVTTFELDLTLCYGVYFVSLAIAKTISHAQMEYLDKRTDALAFKISEPRLKASGIAYLPAQVRTARVHRNGD